MEGEDEGDVGSSSRNRITMGDPKSEQRSARERGYYLSVSTVNSILETLRSAETRTVKPRICTLVGKAILDNFTVSSDSSLVKKKKSQVSVAAAGVWLVSGKWYYEVEMHSISKGYLRVGWGGPSFFPKEISSFGFKGKGVGDDMFSWSIDGSKTKIYTDCTYKCFSKTIIRKS